MFSLLSAVLSLLMAATPGQEPQSKNWPEALGPSQGTWPTAQAEVVWRTNLSEAWEEARVSGRPLFVTARCLPCKQCSDFDKSVLEAGGVLELYLKQFVTVRVTDAAELDFARLPGLQGYQDFDLSWWGYLLSDQAELYAIFGGRDHVSDSTRISAAALANTLSRVLNHHYDPRRKSWNVDGPPVPAQRKAQSVRELKGYDPWLAGNRWAQQQDCVHCHQVADVLRQPAVAAGSFDKKHGVGIWPLPENVGLTLDRDHGLRVTKVAPDSPAQQAGLRVGDVLGAAQGQRLFGQADLRGVLHRNANPAGTIELHWLRDDKVQQGRLQLKEGWRETVLDWRMSISQGVIGADPGFFPLQGKRPDGRKDAMAIRPFYGKDAQRSPAFRAGLKPQMVILAVNGESPPVHGRGFLVWFRLRFDFGDEVVFTVAEGRKTRDIKLRLRPRD